MGYEMGGSLEIKKIIWEMLMCDIIPYARLTKKKTSGQDEEYCTETIKKMI